MYKMRKNIGCAQQVINTRDSPPLNARNFEVDPWVRFSLATSGDTGDLDAVFTAVSIFCSATTSEVRSVQVWSGNDRKIALKNDFFHPHRTAKCYGKNAIF